MNKETKEAAFPLWEAVCYKEDQPPYEVLYEDGQLLVCVKAPGLAVQSASLREKDLESMLRNRLSGQSPQTGNIAAQSGPLTYHGSIATGSGQPPYAESAVIRSARSPYIGVVHRLDQPVQGLVVFAKTRQAAASLSGQIRDHRFQKEYLAVCQGIPKEPKGTLTDYLRKDGKTNTSTVVSPGAPGAKKAVLDYQVLEQQQDQCLVRIQLHTGRHHQIRVQLAHAGMPIVGDQKYNASAKTQVPKGPVSLTRGFGQQGQQLMLCASRLELLHPRTGERKVYSLEQERQ